MRDSCPIEDAVYEEIIREAVVTCDVLVRKVLPAVLRTNPRHPIRLLQADLFEKLPAVRDDRTALRAIGQLRAVWGRHGLVQLGGAIETILRDYYISIPNAFPTSLCAKACLRKVAKLREDFPRLAEIVDIDALVAAEMPR